MLHRVFSVSRVLAWHLTKNRCGVVCSWQHVGTEIILIFEAFCISNFEAYAQIFISNASETFLSSYSIRAPFQHWTQHEIVPLYFVISSVLSSPYLYSVLICATKALYSSSYTFGEDEGASFTAILIGLAQNKIAVGYFFVLNTSLWPRGCYLVTNTSAGSGDGENWSLTNWQE